MSQQLNPYIAKTVCVSYQTTGGERDGGATRKQTDEVGLLEYTYKFNE